MNKKNKNVNGYIFLETYYFLMRFFQISTLCETHESGVFHDIPALNSEVYIKTVAKQNRKFQIYENSENSNLKNKFEVDENTRK